MLGTSFVSGKRQDSVDQQILAKAVDVPPPPFFLRSWPRAFSSQSGSYPAAVKKFAHSFGEI